MYARQFWVGRERLNNYFKGRGLHLFDEEDLL